VLLGRPLAGSAYRALGGDEGGRPVAGWCARIARGSWDSARSDHRPRRRWACGDLERKRCGRRPRFNGGAWRRCPACWA